MFWGLLFNTAMPSWMLKIPSAWMFWGWNVKHSLMGELLSYLCPFHGVIIIFLICAKLMALLLQLRITTLALALFVHLSPRLVSVAETLFLVGLCCPRSQYPWRHFFNCSLFKTCLNLLSSWLVHVLCPRSFPCLVILKPLFYCLQVMRWVIVGAYQ